jgi:hypothetical protein
MDRQSGQNYTGRQTRAPSVRFDPLVSSPREIILLTSYAVSVALQAILTFERL